MGFKVFFSNMGYGRGIDGSFQQHIMRFGHNFYCPLPVQQDVINQARMIIEQEDPDLCCFVEIENRDDYNHLTELAGTAYHHREIAGKYGEKNLYSRLPYHTTKANGLMSKEPFPTKKYFLRHGAKKLVYQVLLPNGMTALFMHLSLRAKVRARQLAEIAQYVQDIEGEVLLMADFNILNGIDEITPLLKEANLHLLNDVTEPTFFFHKQQHVLDLALCSKNMADKISLKIIPQPYSDHAALLANIAA